MGNIGAFKKGNIPFNKGLKQSSYMPAESIEKIKRTQFKAGNKPPNTRQIGAERTDRDGYTYVKVTEKGRWKLKHHLIWEQANGCKVPKGHVVMFADGNRQNFDIDNLVLVSRRNNVAINNRGIKYADKKTLETACCIADVLLTVNEKNK